MKYLLSLVFLLGLPAAGRADSLVVWTDTHIVAGQPYGLELCQYHCWQTVLAELGPFTDTGLPQESFFAASDSIASQFIAYLINPNPDDNVLIMTLGNRNLYGGHLYGYPIPAAKIDGLFISSTGDTVSYGVTGSDLVPEPQEWLMLLTGLGAVFLGLSALQARRFREWRV